MTLHAPTPAELAQASQEGSEAALADLSEARPGKRLGNPFALEFDPFLWEAYASGYIDAWERQDSP